MDNPEYILQVRQVKEYTGQGVRKKASAWARQNNSTNNIKKGNSKSTYIVKEFKDSALTCILYCTWAMKILKVHRSGSTPVV